MSESEAQVAELNSQEGRINGEEGYLKISAAGFRLDVMINHAVNIAVLQVGLLYVQAVVWKE